MNRRWYPFHSRLIGYVTLVKDLRIPGCLYSPSSHIGSFFTLEPSSIFLLYSTRPWPRHFKSNPCGSMSGPASSSSGSCGSETETHSRRCSELPVANSRKTSPSEAKSTCSRPSSCRECRIRLYRFG